MAALIQPIKLSHDTIASNQGRDRGLRRRRLTQSVEGAATRRYAYDPDTNRCALAATCDGTWTYNPADQLIASPQASAYT